MEPNTSTGHHDDQISIGDGNASQTDDGFSSVGDNDADGDVQSVRKSRNSHPSEWITDSKARGKVNKASKAKKAIADKVVIFIVVLTMQYFHAVLGKRAYLGVQNRKMFKNRFSLNRIFKNRTKPVFGSVQKRFLKWFEYEFEKKLSDIITTI